MFLKNLERSTLVICWSRIIDNFGET